MGSWGTQVRRLSGLQESHRFLTWERKEMLIILYYYDPGRQGTVMYHLQILQNNQKGSNLFLLIRSKRERLCDLCKQIHFTLRTLVIMAQGTKISY